jgi:hypothetical protein
MSSLSAAIIARDEARHIAGCLASLAGVADEVVVLVDDRTRDATAKICRQHGAQVYVLPWGGFPAQRSRALGIAHNEWVLFIDADERLTAELAAELRACIAASDGCDGFWIPRYNLFFGRPLRGGGWYPDHQLRLLRRSQAAYDLSRLVHEYASVHGSTGILRGHLVHHNIERLDELWRKQRAYAFAEAQTLYQAGQRTRWRNFVARPLREFSRRYIRLAGWRDGALGLLLCATMAYFELVKFAHLKGLALALEPSPIAQRHLAGHVLPGASRAFERPAQHTTTAAYDLAVVIVSWNVRELLRRCLESVERSLAASGLRAQIVVVDNDSQDGSAEMLCADFPKVELLRPGANLGFAAGNNLALRYLASSARYVLLLNPDTELVGDALPRLVAYLDKHAQVDVLGPQLRYPDGTVQSSRRRFPTAATYFWESTLLAQWRPHNPWLRRYHCAEQADSVEQEVDWLVGAALLVRGTAIERAGLLDEGFFMYSEELEWQWRIRDSAPSVKSVYLPAAIVMHHEGRSSEQVHLKRQLFFQRSKIRLARLRHGKGIAIALRFFLLVTYAWQLAVETLKWLLGHRRDLRAQRIALYWNLLRSGL